MDKDVRLGPGDFDLVRAVLRLNDSMEATAYAVKLVEGLVPYPIGSLEEVREVFERPPSKDGIARIGRHKATFEDAARFLGSEGYPIEDREQLISRVVLGFEARRLETIEQQANQQHEWTGRIENG